MVGLSQHSVANCLTSILEPVYSFYFFQSVSDSSTFLNIFATQLSRLTLYFSVLSMYLALSPMFYSRKPSTSVSALSITAACLYAPFHGNSSSNSWNSLQLELNLASTKLCINKSKEWLWDLHLVQLLQISLLDFTKPSCSVTQLYHICTLAMLTIHL